jgi:hypothetical protein
MGREEISGNERETWERLVLGLWDTVRSLGIQDWVLR